MCAFCPADAVSRGGEHAWSAWMGRLIASKGFRLYSFTEEGLQRTYKKRKLDEKFPVVCNECNHGWMSDLENRHAKPAIKDLILSDKLTKLTPERLESSP
jgi:hypothetical protein